MNRLLGNQQPLSSQLQRMLSFIQHDPENLALIADTAAIAFDCGAMDITSELLERHQAIKNLTPAMLNLRGMVALAEGQNDIAVESFAALVAGGTSDPGIRFNLAWACAMAGEYARALPLLDDATLAASVRAPALKIRVMHHLAQYDEALAEGRRLVALRPDDADLLGALSVLALDTEDLALAKSYARQAGTLSSDAASTLGTLELNDHKVEEAMRWFQSALSASPNHARGWIGTGLGQLATGDPAAADSLDRGAELFRHHIGSWIAAGWAHFLKGNQDAARLRFDTALALDDNFAESHGSLAVLDAYAGDRANAERRAKIAMRLDRTCFSAALAQSILLEQAGHGKTAAAIRTRALETPIGVGGTTIGQALIGLGLGKSPR
jgi:tetratricopeptide (TPR) repeat protein